MEPQYATNPEIGGSKSLAQQRRQMENQEFAKLAMELPLARAISGQHIDKTTMVRLAVSFIKLHNVLQPTNSSNFTSAYDAYWGANKLDLMDSFLMVVDAKGDILYVSETISIYLGLSQVDMTGNGISEYIHTEDWPKFQQIFLCSESWSDTCNLRIKSSLTKRANKDSSRSSPGYKVIKMDVVRSGACRFLHCLPLPSLVLSTVSIQPHSFVISTNVDLTITMTDDRAEDILNGINSIGTGMKDVSFYSLIHVADTETIRKMHYEVFCLGAYRTPYYRMIINKGHHTFFVESTVYRFSTTTSKGTLDSITIVTNIL